MIDGLEEHVDPFDLDVFSPYLRANVHKAVLRSSVCSCCRHLLRCFVIMRVRPCSYSSCCLGCLCDVTGRSALASYSETSLGFISHSGEEHLVLPDVFLCVVRLHFSVWVCCPPLFSVARSAGRLICLVENSLAGELLSRLIAPVVGFHWLTVLCDS